MATSLITGGLTNAAVARGLASPNKYNFIASFHQQKFNYLKLTELIANKIGSRSYGVSTADLKVKTMVMYSSNLYSNITGSVSDGGTQLILTLSEANGLQYNVNDTVLNKTGQKLGIVTATSTNTITIKPITGETLTAGTDFATGQTVAQGSILSPDRNSGPVPGRKVMPIDVDDYIRTYRTNRYFARTDYAATFINQALNNSDPQGLESALVQLQMDDLAYQMAFDMEKGMLFDRMGIQMINNEESRTQMGFFQAVDERGGIPINSPNPITFNKMNEIALDVFNNYNASSNEIFVLAGSKAKARVIEGGQLYKYTAGKNSVLASEFETAGIDFKTWETGFGTITLLDNTMFNDVNFLPNYTLTGYTSLQESMIFISATTMKDQLGRAIPVIQDYHGAYGGNSEGIKMSYTPGLIGKDGKFVMETANQLDGVTMGQIAHAGKIIANSQPAGYFAYQG